MINTTAIVYNIFFLSVAFSVFVFGFFYWSYATACVPAPPAGGIPPGASVYSKSLKSLCRSAPVRGAPYDVSLIQTPSGVGRPVPPHPGPLPREREIVASRLANRMPREFSRIEL